jgi:hypothetical protein
MERLAWENTPVYLASSSVIKIISFIILKTCASAIKLFSFEAGAVAK